MDVRTKGVYTIIKLDSDLIDDEAVSSFKNSIQEIIVAGSHYLILDFENIQIINSNGIGKILLFYKNLKEYDGSIGFLNLNSNIRDLFEKLMFFNLFKEYKSEDEIE